MNFPMLHVVRTAYGDVILGPKVLAYCEHIGGKRWHERSRRKKMIALKHEIESAVETAAKIAAVNGEELTRTA